LHPGDSERRYHDGRRHGKNIEKNFSSGGINMLKILFAIPVLLSFFLPSPAAAIDPKVTLSLSEAIETAIKRNASVKEAEELKLGAEEDIKSTRADFFPKASTRYNYTRLEDKPFQRIGGIERAIGDEDGHHWDVTLVQPVFKGFGIFSRYGMATLSAQIKDLEWRQVILDVSREVKIAWFESLLSKKMETVTEDNVTALKSHETDAEGFFKHGIIPLNDLLKSRVAVATAVQEREKARAGAEMARSHLFTVMGIGLDAERAAEEDTELTLTGSHELPVLTEEAIRNRPILASFRLGLENLEKSVTLAKSAYYPEVSLAGRYERNGDDFGAKNNDYSNDHNASVSLQATWVFFEWGKTGAEVNRQRFSRQALAEKMKGVEDQIRLETKSAFLDLTVAQKNIATAEEGRKQATESWRITNLQYQHQVTTSTEVLDARAFLSQAETNYYRALYGYQIAVARLESAVGRK
jgi:outer membrane protein